ncbi:MAG TPA: ABC transporter permease [Thermoplasmata archaeon]|nr:ABC transporter permease [Thermoplasmata archaeon]
MSGLLALTGREIKKWYKNPFVLFISLVQPIIWMGLFGKAMNLGAIVPTNLPAGTPNPLAGFLGGVSDYFSFMAVGMLAFVVLFATMFSGMSIVWDRRLGFLNKVLSTPASRGSIVLSKVFIAVIRALVQAGIVLIAAVVLGLVLGPDFTPLSLIAVFGALFLMSIGLSAMFVAIAIRSTKWETQMAIMNLLNLPLLFASNALFPTASMPSWLQDIAKVNPVTYGTEAARQLILLPTNWSVVGGDFLFLGIFATVFAAIGIALSWRYLTK